MRACFPGIFGNQALRRRICDAVTARTLSHAYIIEGPDGCGKRTFAKSIAAALACEARTDDLPLPCGTCSHCRKILTESSPDVRYIEPSGTTISVDAIREARADMYLSSTEEDCKVYIIDGAHAMTPQAQNALLIVLEEPPTNLIIFLLTDRADALLPTIRSRAALLRMGLLTRAEMDAALAENKSAAALRVRDPAAYDALLENAAGCLGTVLDMLDSKESAELMQNRACAEALVTGMVEGADFTALLPRMQALPTKRAELNPILTLTATALRDLIVLRGAENAPLCFYTDRAAALLLAERAGIQRLLRLSDAVARAQDALAVNANVQLTLLTLFTEIK